MAVLLNVVDPLQLVFLELSFELLAVLSDVKLARFLE